MPSMMLPELWSRIRPLVFIGWGVAAIRLGLEWTEPAATYWFGLYFVMPLPLLYLGWRGRFDGLSWPRLALAMFVLAICVWGLTNAVTYSVGQFMGWQHGRFAPNRAAPIEDNPLMKVVRGLSVGGLTALASAVWLLAFATLLVWLPRRLRRAAAPRA